MSNFPQSNLYNHVNSRNVGTVWLLMSLSLGKSFRVGDHKTNASRYLEGMSIGDFFPLTFPLLFQNTICANVVRGGLRLFYGMILTKRELHSLPASVFE